MTKSMLKKVLEFIDEYWNEFVDYCDSEKQAEKIKEELEEIVEG